MPDHTDPPGNLGVAADTYLERLFDRGGTDLILSAGARPTARVNGELVAIGEEVLTPPATAGIVEQLLPPERRALLERDLDVDFSLNWRNRCRFRGNAYWQRGALAVALRLIPYRIPSPADLGLPAAVAGLARLRQGLVLITGSAGSGKSTTVAALIDAINQGRACHIITIEDPVEFVHTHKRAIVDQREIGLDARGFPSALRAALRQDPDVIAIGEMRDLDTIQTAVTVAETGHLVFGTLHTNDSAQAVDRMIDVFPADQQQQIRVQISQSLVAVVNQQLIPSLQGGLVAAHELLLATPAVKNLVREGQTRQIRNVIATSSATGMQTLERSLSELIEKGIISPEQALSRSLHPDELQKAIAPAGSRLTAQPR